MGIRTLVGSTGGRGPIEGFARRFDVLELDVLDRDPAPRDATLRKWRKEAGPTLQISIVAPKALALVRPTPALDDALTRYLEAQRLLQARFLLIQTPSDVTPGELQRERLAKVVERVREGLGEAKDLVRIAWEPRGVWEADTAATFAQKLGVDLALDPLADPREPFFHPVLRYWRLGTVGGRTEFPPVRLRFLAEVIAAEAKSKQEGERVVIFTTPHANKEAKRLVALAKSLESRSPASGGAIIRPRGSLALPEGDDE
jgi:uncharacterized protein YecE (DUF72 family)